VDATARGISDGDPVRVYNDRGQILCSAVVTETIKPGIVDSIESPYFTAQNPGDPTSLDLGGSIQCLIDKRQPDALCDGHLNYAACDVEKWSGGV
jgi:trimethylamine-N-oxide reductase (cytochrome c)